MKKLIFIVMLLFLCFSFLETIKPQGSWIVQNTHPSMSGVYLTKAGSDCIIHTKTSSSYVYFFDIYLKAWIEYNVGSQQNMVAVDAGKHVVFTYSDSLLIAYSSLASKYQSISYSGNIISPQGTASGTRGYGCGDNAAYVWTDQNIFYVFDGLIGEWKWFDYGETQNASGAYNFWCGDNYVAGIFQRYAPDKHKNVVYSLATGTFNKIENGGQYYTTTNTVSMTGGFVSTFVSGPDDALLAGYSAFTNQFYIVQEFPPFYGNINLAGLDDSWKFCEKRNVYGYTLTKGFEQVKDITIRMFDTEKAAWFTLSLSYDITESNGISSPKVSGNTSLSFMYDIQSNEVTFYIFSGENGEFLNTEPGIMNNIYYLAGNTYVSSLDYSNSAWFFNTKTGFSSLQSFNESDFSNIKTSADYMAFCQYETVSPTMELWFYNAHTDKTSKVEISKDVNPHYTLSPWSYIFVPSSANDVAIFYSPIHDSILPVNTTLAGPGAFYKSQGVFSWLYNASSTLLFDAANLQSLDFNTLILPAADGAVSNSLALFRKGNIYDVYDASTGNTSNFDMGTTPGYNYNGGNIVLVSTSNYSIFYAFQKGRDEWVELIPEGNSLYYSASENTAVVVRFAKVYAFAPAIVSDISDQETENPKHAVLFQNYPNPFSSKTTIKWRSEIGSWQTLKIYNSFGQEIRTLLNEYKSPGNYEVELDEEGLSAGIYFYTLQAGDFIEMKKMILIK